MHLAAASKVVADDCLVVRVKTVRVLGLDHYLIGLEQPLLASLDVLVLLSVDFIYGLLV